MSSRPSRGAARLAAILDALPDALLLVNANGTVVNANSIALETFEAPGTALVGRGLLDLLPGFDSKRIPGSMRRPDPSEGPRTKPTRMIARRTDGSEFPVEVTSANLEDARTPYADAYTPYTGDELLMLVVRDLTGTLDTENELARQQRQTEMILRAASEGVVGVDTECKVVLVNPAAAQILGYRASDLGGQELHPLIHHSRPDGTPLPYEETPLADTLRSGRKHRVRGQVLWTKAGRPVPVDLTTAPVREGEQLVGAVMTFTDRTRLNSLASRHAQLRAVLDASLRAPLEELRGELSGLASDPAAQLWPEANQILHHLAAGYARMTSLIDNVLAYQRLDAGTERLERRKAKLDEVVSAGVEGAIELIGPGRAQYAVHAPPIKAMVDGPRLAQAITHLIVDVSGVDPTGRTAVTTGDSTIVVAAAQRDDFVRIDVRGPHGGGSPVHLPIARGVVERHGGMLRAQDVPGGQGGSAYVIEVPIGDLGEPDDADGDPEPDRSGDTGVSLALGMNLAGSGRDGREHDSGMTVMPRLSDPVRGTQAGAPGSHGVGSETGRPPGPRRPVDEGAPGRAPGTAIALPAGPAADSGEQPTGRRRALRRGEPDGPETGTHPGAQAGVNGPSGANFTTGANPSALPELSSGRPGQGPLAQGPHNQGPHGPAVPGQGQQGHGMPPQRLPGHGLQPLGPQGQPPQNQLPPGQPSQGHGPHGQGMPAQIMRELAPHSERAHDAQGGPAASRRARRALSDGQQPELPARTVHALPPGGNAGGNGGQGEGQTVATAPAVPAQQQGPGQGQGQPMLPAQATGADSETHPHGRRARREDWPDPQAGPQLGLPAGPQTNPQAGPQSGAYAGATGDVHTGHAAHAGIGTHGAPQTQSVRSPAAGLELPPARSPEAAGPEPTGRRARHAPAGPQHPGAMPPTVDHAGHGGHAAPGQHDAHEAEARAISVRTLGQGVAFTAQAPPETMAPQQPQHQPPHPQHSLQPHQPNQPQQQAALPVPSNGSGRRRRLAAPQVPGAPGADPAGAGGARPHPADSTGARPALPALPANPAFHPSDTQGHGQTFTIGAPAEGDEGPEMLDGPGGAIEVMAGPANARAARAAARPEAEFDGMDEELSGPRRLLVWPEPDVSTRQALTRPRLPAGDGQVARGGRRPGRRVPGRAVRRPADRADHPDRAAVAARGGGGSRGAGTGDGGARTGHPRGGVRGRPRRAAQGARPARQRPARRRAYCWWRPTGTSRRRSPRRWNGAGCRSRTPPPRATPPISRRRCARTSS